MDVVVVGCGVVGASIAYELSRVSGLRVRVLEKDEPALGSTAAALGVLMGVVSHKVKGKNWRLRLASMRRYESLIPELEELTGRRILYNRNGILMLCFDEEELGRKQHLAEVRKSQGFELEIIGLDNFKKRFPQVCCEGVLGAVFSPDDRQVDPVGLTAALVDGAQRNGAVFEFGVGVEGFDFNAEKARVEVRIRGGIIGADWVVIAAGLGSFGLQNQVEIKPVLGQGLLLRLPQPLADNCEPVITGNDVHIVPVGGGDYWVGATVEFTDVADDGLLDEVLRQAVQFCPQLEGGEIVRKWSGLRPRPEGRPAPVIEALSGYKNVLLATGHYRNGVLLAPATALAIRQMIAPEVV
ncbi:FAD-binding oxidoreductase [Ancylothrix sp. C2]|uniref:NAD(P)/FAD-dependent oxidoreductase n=1 Tax=Ancylothrix sp. D3o TaxID=2953691 RepID=UPI0021BB4D3E|nr:FAD-dependent oxidoreductase [Ancylothrix sp. D3o]MCT7949424.1 FAD-binding oxidoreductase [Ancylothrix sp. D3o]